jgi:hypothetical protein
VFRRGAEAVVLELRAAFALLKGSRRLGEEHEVVGEDAENEFAGLGRIAACGQR